MTQKYWFLYWGCISLVFVFSLDVFAQPASEGVGINTTNIDPHAVLDINVSGSTPKGIKLPSYVPSQLLDIEGSTTSEGILFFDNTNKQIFNTVIDDNNTVVEPVGWGMHGNDLGSLSGSGYYLGTNDPSHFKIGTNGTTRMTFNRTGPIIVGDHTSPTLDAAFQINTDEGILLPRLTSAERQAVQSPSPGLFVYDTDDNTLYVGIESQGSFRWDEVGGGGGGSDNDWTIGTGEIYNTTDNIGIGTSNPVNLLDVAGGVAIGSGFAGSGQTTVQPNGMNIEGHVGIGFGGLSYAQLVLQTPSNLTTYLGIYNLQQGAHSTDGYAMVNYNNMSTNSNKYGLWNGVTSTGTGEHYGIYNISSGNSSSSSDMYGISSKVDGSGTGSMYGLYLDNQGSGQGTDYGVYSVGEDFNYFAGKVGIGDDGNDNLGGNNYKLFLTTDITTSGAVYGIYNKVNSPGTSHKYGLYNYVYGNVSSSGTVYGINQYVYHEGTGPAYGLRLQNNGAGSGTDYGIYSTGEDENYFNGSMRIGTTSSTGKLQVNQSGADPLIRFQKSGTTYLIVGNNGNTALYYNTAPAYKLQLNVNEAAKPTSSSWTVSSDGRLKKDVETFSDGLNLLMQINPVWFSYTGEAGMPTDERGVGTIAQDLQKIAPYMVHEWTYVEGSTDENNKEPRGAKRTYLGVDYGAMDFVLINSIKDQQKMIEDQQQQITILKEEIEQLKEK